MSARRAAAWFGLTLCALACSDQRPPPQPARFDRPSAVAFACVQNGEAVQLRHCASIAGDDDLALHALVTQSARGEIAAVNLETQRVLDSRRDIPGFTFVPVGETPVAVLVPPDHPELTYIADYGSRDIRVLATDLLVSPLSGDPTLQTVRLEVTTADGTATAGPTDMALSPDEDALIVAAPEVGRVFYLPLQRCAVGSDTDCREGLIDEDRVIEIALESSRDRLVASTAAPPTAQSYAQLCGFERPQPPAVEPAAVSDDVMMTGPKPSALAIDADCPEGAACAPRVLIADEALPVIHALDLDVLAATGDAASAVLDPLFTGVPTRRVVAAPWVPASLDPEDASETQFVYAIDATDGSVLVLEGGQVLSVNAGATGRPDRIAFNTTAGATSLAIATPAFDPAGGAQQWLAESQCFLPQDPARLRGVFLAAALTDQSVRIVDVHDMDLQACRSCAAPGIPVLQRHQLRLAENFLDESQNADTAPSLRPGTNVIFVEDGLPFAVRSDGTTGSPEAPGLDCIACESELVQSFPPPADDDDEAPIGDGDDAGVDDGNLVNQGCAGDAPALVCSNQDPWADHQNWFAVYEGTIPGTGGKLGQFIPEGSAESQSGAMEFLVSGELDFCAAGVLGEDDIAAAYTGRTCDAIDDPDEAARAAEPDGDQLVITARPLTPERLAQLGLTEGDDRAVVERCARIRDALTLEDARPIAFEIRRAFRDRLVLRTTLAYPVGGVRSFEDVEPCLERGLLTFDVRGYEQFVVFGGRSGFLHRVRANPAGRCEVDPEADELLQGRARLGCTYRNTDTQFKLHRPQEGELDPTPLLEFRMGSETPARKLQTLTGSVISGSVIGVQLLYNQTDSRLYLVDVHGRGLMPIPVDPLPPSAPRSFN